MRWALATAASEPRRINTSHCLAANSVCTGEEVQLIYSNNRTCCARWGLLAARARRAQRRARRRRPGRPPPLRRRPRPAGSAPPRRAGAAAAPRTAAAVPAPARRSGNGVRPSAPGGQGNRVWMGCLLDACARAEPRSAAGRARLTTKQAPHDNIQRRRSPALLLVSLRLQESKIAEQTSLSNIITFRRRARAWRCCWSPMMRSSAAALPSMPPSGGQLRARVRSAGVVTWQTHIVMSPTGSYEDAQPLQRHATTPRPRTPTERTPPPLPAAPAVRAHCWSSAQAAASVCGSSDACRRSDGRHHASSAGSSWPNAASAASDAPSCASASASSSTCAVARQGFHGAVD